MPLIPLSSEEAVKIIPYHAG